MKNQTTGLTNQECTKRALRPMAVSPGMQSNFLKNFQLYKVCSSYVSKEACTYGLICEDKLFPTNC